MSWVGVGLTLPYFGAEIFGPHAIGQRAVGEHDPALIEMVDAVRFNPAAITIFATGLVLLAVGAILAAAAIWRSGVLARWSGVPLAVGFVLFMPQFTAPPSIRIAHGVLVAIGCLRIALGLLRSRDRAPDASS